MRDLLRRLLFLPEGASTASDRIDDLHFVIIFTTMAVGAMIAAVALVFLVRYRRRQSFAQTPKVRAPWWLEAAFIIIPLATFLTWGVLGFLDFQWAHEAPPDALDVYVMGKQWMWKFAYADGASDVGRLRVPANKPIRLLITSRDVIHSFYVPAFRIKQDAVPGRYTEIWFEAKHAGRFPIFCAEYCGLDHSVMRAEVEVMEPDAFERWRHGETDAVALAEKGKQIAAEKGCLKCHALDGSAHIAPSWLGLYGRDEPLTGGGRVRVDEPYLTESMMEPHAKVVAGFDPVMPAFQGQLQPADVAAIVELIKSLKTEAPRAPEEPVYEQRKR